MGALAYARQLLEALPALLSAGQSVADLVTHGTDALKVMQAENRGPTPAETGELDARIKALRDELHAP